MGSGGNSSVYIGEEPGRGQPGRARLAHIVVIDRETAGQVGCPRVSGEPITPETSPVRGRGGHRVFLRAAAGDAVRVMRALIVDDQASIRSVISKVLSRAGATCEMAGSGEEALERLARAPYDMVFIDLALPGMDGLGLARLIAHRYPDVPMVMITGSAKFEMAVAAMQ